MRLLTTNQNLAGSNSSTATSPTAYWDGNTRELVLCYELIDAFSQLAGEERIRELAQQIRGFHQNNAGKSESER